MSIVFVLFLTSYGRLCTSMDMLFNRNDLFSEDLAPQLIPAEVVPSKAHVVEG